MKTQLRNDYDVFIQRQETPPHFVQSLQLTKDTEQLSNSMSRIQHFQGQGGSMKFVSPSPSSVKFSSLL